MRPVVTTAVTAATLAPTSARPASVSQVTLDVHVRDSG